jgi:hydrogenase-4 component E
MTWLTLISVACALAVVIVRRPAAGAAALVVQSAALAVIAGLGESGTATAVLASKALLLTALLTLVVRQSRHSPPVHARLAPTARLVVTLLVAGTLLALTPPLGLTSERAQQASLLLLGCGFAIAITRRSTLLQLIGVMVAENGVVLAALSSPNPMPFVIEIGVAVDVMLVAFVAVALHQRIEDELGAGDTALLRSLRD